jgi:uncharacterized protein YwqG
MFERIDHRRRYAMQSAAAFAVAAMLPVPARAARTVAKAKTGADRTFPMFKDEADARALIKQYCVDEAATPLKVAEMELVMARLRPQFWIAQSLDAGGPRWRTHFGGAPELPKGAAWPLRPPALHAKAAVDDLLKVKTGDTWIADHLAREVPFEFLAQIDLAEATQHPAVSEGLPASGRLLFFWDGVVGTYAGGAAACRVIWDDTPAAELQTAAIPPVFEELETAFAVGQHASAQETIAAMLKALPDTIRIMKSAGVSDKDIEQAQKAIREQAKQTPALDPNLKKPYVYPRRAMKLTPILHLPHAHTVEAARDDALSRLLQNDALAECYRILTSRDEGPFTKETSGRRRQRFLGTPNPEQDDPRYEAIDRLAYPPGAWSDATLRDASAQASAWRLLLQIDVADLAQVQGEGTVYFVIRNDALARRDFSGVHATYQQT